MQASDSRGPFTGTPHGPTFRVAGPKLCQLPCAGQELTPGSWAARGQEAAFKDEEQKTDNQTGHVEGKQRSISGAVLTCSLSLESCERNSGTC